MSVFRSRQPQRRKHLVRLLPQSQGESGFATEFSYAPASSGATPLTIAGTAGLKKSRAYYTGAGVLTTAGAATTSKLVATQTFSHTASGAILLSGVGGLKLIKSFTPNFLGFITLAWDPSAGATGYKLYYDTNSGVPYTGTGAIRGDNGQVANSPIDVGNVTQFTVQGLPLNTTFFFAVSSYNSFGAESDLSNELSDTLLSADAFSFRGSAGVLKSKLFVATASGGMVLAGASTFKKSKSYAGSGGLTTDGIATTSILSGTEAFSYTGSGALLLAGGSTLKLLKAFTPDFLGFITLDWDPAANTDGYKIYYGTSSGVYTGTGAVRGDNNQVDDSPIDVGNVTTFFLKGLQLYTTYYFAVAAYNTAGESPKSNEFSDTLFNGVFIVSGSAVFTRTKLFLTTSSGGMLLGGLAALKRTRALSGSGVLSMSGVASNVLVAGTQTFSVTGSGGLVTSGIGGLKFLRKAQSVTAALQFSGSATLKKVLADLASATAVLFAGTATLKKTKAFSGSGVLTTGGAATTALVGPTVGIFLFTGGGVLLMAGAASLMKVKLHSASGGLVTSGEAALKKLMITTISGGPLVMSGASIQTLIKKFTTSGVLTMGGTATTSLVQIIAGHFVYIAGGSLVISGSSSLFSLVKSVPGSGGLVFGGFAVITIPIIGIASTITVSQLMAELATMLLENPDFSCSTLWNATEIIDFINATQQEFILRTQALKRNDRITLVPPTKRYTEPIQTMQIDRITLDDIALEQTFSTLLDLEEPKWRTKVGVPKKYHVDHLPKKTFELNREPAAQLSSSVLGTLGTYAPDNVLDVNDRLMVPDYCGMYIKFGVLARMLEKDGEAMDVKRAAYCRQRFEFGAELLSRLMVG